MAKKTKTNCSVRFNWPDSPEVALPWYPRSAGRSIVPSDGETDLPGFAATELIWMTKGRMELFFEHPPRVVTLSAGESFFRLPGDVRHCRNTASSPAEYCFVCFDGAKAAEFLLDYQLDRENPLPSGACPEYLFNELEELLRINSPYALRRTVAVVAEVIAAMAGNPVPAATSGGETVAHAITVIHRNFRYREFNVSQLAEAVGIHRATLNRLFFLRTGKGPLAYLTECRIAKALELLRDTPLSVGEVAAAVGFASGNYLGRLVYRAIGETPQRYRKAHETHCGSEQTNAGTPPDGTTEQNL